MEKPILIVSSKDEEELINAVREGFCQKLGETYDFDIVEDEKITGGFIAIIDGRVYDASISSRLSELGRMMSRAYDDDRTAESTFATVGTALKQKVLAYEAENIVYEYGVVENYADDIVQIKGLSTCHAGELLSFDGGAIGLTMDLRLGGVSAAILSGSLSSSSVVHATGRIAEVCVGDELLGRVIDPLGNPIDGKPLLCLKYRPIEAPAPTLMQRSPVNTPLETGILAIDSMIPIGRGQRELIIGDRQTGKTSIALASIINQRDKGVLCVYCAIGQKASTVSGIVHTLEKAGAMQYTVVVHSSGSDTPAMQYIAPYAACAVAEEFMYSGRDVLVVYDDLSKHAVAYRTMSLLLRRPSGREAYPGDVFYLHSRLLERAAKLNEQLGGGSMTALPIVETMAGDISAYIPTNVISITDGQIYLETELHSAGIRPAVNVGLSVSRVGRAAQNKAMRDVSGSLRLEVAQYRDMAVFAQFGADIDVQTRNQLSHGERLMQLLIQPTELNYSLSQQTAVLYAASCGLFEKVPVKLVDEAQSRLVTFLARSAPGIMRNIDTSEKLSDNDKYDLERLFERFHAENGDLHGRD